jgi:hypothetical protein
MSYHENTKKRRFHGWTNPVLISGTPHGDQRSLSREVPAPKGMIDNVAIADTISLENVVEAPKIFFKYGARRYYTKSKNRWQAK